MRVFSVPTASGRIGPLVAAGLLLGAGLGGFVDGIVLHQLLQFHQMLSARVPVRTLADAHLNMRWDGWFHAGVWLLTVAGVVRLFQAGRRSDVPWSGRVLAGSALLGWGLFNLVEGIVNHHLLGLHHVMEQVPDKRPADLSFLVVGLLLAVAGATLVRAGRSAGAPRRGAT